MYDFSGAFGNLNGAIDGLGKKFEDRRSTEALLAAYDQSQGGTPAAPRPTGLAALGQMFMPQQAQTAPQQPAGQPLPPLGQPAPPAQGPGGLGDIFAQQEAQRGLPPGYLQRTAAVESRGNPNAQNPNSSAGGLFQFIDSTAKQYGLTNKMDPVASTEAAARLAADNQGILRQALGREPTAGELYLAHQQGGGGASKLLANPNARAVDVVGADAVRLNGGTPDMTAGQFASRWISKLDGGQPVQTAQAAPQPGMPMSDAPAPGAAEAQGFAVPGAKPAAAPADKTNVNSQMIRGLLANPGTREIGKQLWAQTLSGKSYGFQVIGDQLYRTNASTGAAEPVQGITNPKAALDMRKAEIDIQKGERDLAGKGFRTLNSEERAAAGVDPAFKGVVQVDRDGQLHFPGKAGTEVKLTNEGTIPVGYRMKRDAQGNPTELEPIPGGPAAEKVGAAAEKETLNREAKQSTGNTVLTALDDIDRLMKEATLPTTGALGSRVADIKGTAAHDIKSALTTVGANISFDKLSEMRAASPTGGALGAVTENELKLLENSMAALQQSQSEGQFKANLGRVRANFEKVVHGKRLSDQERKADGPMTMERAKSLRSEAQAAIAGGAPKEEVAKRLKEKYGITPEGL